MRLPTPSLRHRVNSNFIFEKMNEAGFIFRPEGTSIRFNLNSAVKENENSAGG